MVMGKSSSTPLVHSSRTTKEKIDFFYSFGPFFQDNKREDSLLGTGNGYLGDGEGVAGYDLAE